MKTPEQEIAEIIKQHNLIDPGEVADLQIMVDNQKTTNYSYPHPHTELDGVRRKEILTKILNWIRA